MSSGKATVNKKQKIRYKLRFRLVFLSFLLLGLVIVGRAFYVQILTASHLQQKMAEYRQQGELFFRRGKIVDRYGVLLAQDTVLYDLYADPRSYNDVSPQAIARATSPYLNIPPEKLSTLLAQNSPSITVAKNLPKGVRQKIRQEARVAKFSLHPKTHQLVKDENGNPVSKKIAVPGLNFIKKLARVYPQGTLGAHILGYVNDEAQISSGVELTQKPYLTERPRVYQKPYQVDGKGHPILVYHEHLDSVTTVPEAQDVVLTIDSRLQYLAEKELAAGVQRSKAKRGTVLMMVPETGEILAFAVYPTYDPNHFRKASQEVLKNWAVTDAYEPGSTIKILTIASGLETGAIHKNSRLYDEGRMKLGGWTVPNYDYGRRGAPGWIDLVYLFQHSSNVGSIKVAMMMNKQQYWEQLRKFGIGQKTGIEVPGESAGDLISAKDWDRTRQATTGYGYGFLTTPLQLAAAVSAIANNGVWVTPHLIKYPSPKITSRRVLSVKNAQTVTDLLAQSIEKGKHPAKLPDYTVAGKTGTAKQRQEGQKGYGNNLYTSFIGFLPETTPKLLMMVVVDSPTIAESWGSTVAAPVFNAIAKEAVHTLQLKPDKLKPDRIVPTNVATGSKRADTSKKLIIKKVSSPA